MKRNLAIRTIAKARFNGPEKFSALRTSRTGEILHWDESVLGAVPTEAEIEAVMDTIPDPTPPVPSEIASWRLRAIARLNSKDHDIQLAITAMDEPQRTVAEAAWDLGSIIERQHPLVLAIGQALEMTPTQMDDWFRQAASL